MIFLLPQVDIEQLFEGETLIIDLPFVELNSENSPSNKGLLENNYLPKEEARPFHPWRVS